MIHGISGRTGSGKSYEAVVSHIIPTLVQKRRKIVTNIPLNIDKICSVYGEECRGLIHFVDGNWHDFGGSRPFSKTDHYLQFQSWQNLNGQRCVFFIDEAHLALPTQGTDKQLLEFYSLHRQYGFDIYLITQHFRKIHRDIRDLIDNHYRCIKKSFAGQPNKYVMKIHNGGSSSNSTVVNTVEREYEPRWFSFYKSHTKSDKDVQEDSSEGVKKWWDNWFIKGGVLFVAFAIFNTISSLAGGSEDSDPKKDQSQPAVQPLPQNLNSQVNDAQVLDQRRSTQAKQSSSEPEEIDPKKAMHPFHKVQLHIGGWAEYSIRGQLKRDYHLAASQNGQYIFDLSIRDLYLAGYTVVVRSKCMIEISFEHYHDYLTCDSPKVNMLPQDSLPEISLTAEPSGGT